MISRWLAAFKLEPMLVAVSSAAVPLGMSVIVLGEMASRAFTVLGGDVPARMIGLALFTCGIMMMSGIFSNNSFIQALGAASGVGGFALYSGGCYLGLGVNGVISGTFAAAVAAGYFGRVLKVIDLARVVADE